MAPPTLRPVSRHRWCTNLLVGDADGAGRVSELGDSVMIARDGDATRVHVHTDDPDAVIALFDDVLQVELSDIARRRRRSRSRRASRRSSPRSASRRSRRSRRSTGSVTVIAEPQAALVASLAFDAARPCRRRTPPRCSTRSPACGPHRPAGGDLAAGLVAALLQTARSSSTVLTGEDAPLGDEEIRALVPPGVEVEVTPGAGARGAHGGGSSRPSRCRRTSPAPTRSTTSPSVGRIRNGSGRRSTSPEGRRRPKRRSRWGCTRSATSSSTCRATPARRARSQRWRGRDGDGARRGALHPVAPGAAPRDEAARRRDRGGRHRAHGGDVLQPAVARAPLPARDAAHATGKYQSRGGSASTTTRRPRP